MTKRKGSKLTAAAGRSLLMANLKDVGTYYCMHTLNFCVFPNCLLDLEFGVITQPSIALSGHCYNTSEYKNIEEL